MSTRSRDPRYPRRIVVLGAAIACWLALGVVSAAALSSTDQQLLSSPNLEIRPSANDTMLAWSENSHAHPRFFNVFVRPLAGGQVKRLNADDTRGYNGGFDGSELIFQQISNQRQAAGAVGRQRNALQCACCEQPAILARARNANIRQRHAGCAEQ